MGSSPQRNRPPLRQPWRPDLSIRSPSLPVSVVRTAVDDEPLKGRCWIEIGNSSFEVVVVWPGAGSSRYRLAANRCLRRCRGRSEPASTAKPRRNVLTVRSDNPRDPSNQSRPDCVAKRKDHCPSDALEGPRRAALSGSRRSLGICSVRWRSSRTKTVTTHSCAGRFPSMRAWSL